MTRLRAHVQRAALAAYRVANRRGLLDSRVAETVFQRSYFAYKGLVEDPFAKLAAARPDMFRGGDVIDVGANIGYTAVLFARAIDSGRTVHAFEPEERNFRWLENTIARTGLTGRIHANRAAVGAYDGTVDLWRNDAHHADHRIATETLREARSDATQSVPLVSVDTFVASIGAPPIAFVKIDVQGYEPEVLRGMHATLAANPGAYVAVELMPSALDALGFDSDRFVRDLMTALPRVEVLERTGRLRDIDPDAITHQTRESDVGYVDLVCSRG